jgi:hypothetical protein
MPCQHGPIKEQHSFQSSVTTVWQSVPLGSNSLLTQFAEVQTWKNSPGNKPSLPKTLKEFMILKCERQRFTISKRFGEVK